MHKIGGNMERIGTLLGTPRKEEANILGPRNPRRGKTQKETDAIADYLVERFNSPEFRPLFLRVAWRLDRGTIDRLVGTSFELGKNPRAYFISLVKQEKAYYTE